LYTPLHLAFDVYTRPSAWQLARAHETAHDSKDAVLHGNTFLQANDGTGNLYPCSTSDGAAPYAIATYRHLERSDEAKPRARADAQTLPL
jgi:hypothetical protein